MNYITLVGPNAIGKTTAVRRWAQRYGQLGLVVISADLQLVVEGDREYKESGWSGTVAEKQALVKKWQSDGRVVVVESARTDILRFANGLGYLFVVTCSGEAHRQHLIDRCLKRGKTFREDYWTLGKCQYEGTGRYVNCAEANHPSATALSFQVNAYSEWGIVDEVFGKLFRKLHNARPK